MFNNLKTISSTYYFAAIKSIFFRMINVLASLLTLFFDPHLMANVSHASSEKNRLEGE